MAFYLTNMSRRRIIASQPNDITREGSIVSFGTNIARPMQVTCALTPVQSGSGDPSPSNIRPITGWTGCDVTGAGVNLFDKTGTDTDKGYVSGYYLFYTGALNQGADWRVSEYIKVKPNTAYTLSGLTGNSPAVCFYDANKAYVSGTQYNGNASVTVTTGATVAYCRLSFKTDNINAVQLEQGSSASSYSAYSGTTIPITWQTEAGTVYGGTMTLNRDGSVTVVVSHVGVDMGSLTWNYASSYAYFTTSIDEIKKYTAGETPSILCETYKTTTSKSASDWTSAENCTIGTRSGLATIVVKDTAYTDKTAFTTAVTGKKVVYPLATPVAYTLSASSALNSLLGVNNVWADAGDVSVKAWGF